MVTSVLAGQKQNWAHEARWSSTTGTEILEGSKDFFLSNACHFREFLNWTGTSGLACHLRVIPLTDGDVGHYDKELSATRSLGVFDWPCNSERVKILPWFHEIF